MKDGPTKIHERLKCKKLPLDQELDEVVRILYFKYDSTKFNKPLFYLTNHKIFGALF